MNKFLILIIFGLISCNFNPYGDIDLGGNFYYIVDPDFNSVVIPVKNSEPYKSGIYIIKEIEKIGFNKNLILIESKSKEIKQFWKIDKTKEQIKLGYSDSLMKLSNVNELDSIEYNRIIISEKIEMKSKLYYQKELNYIE